MTTTAFDPSLLFSVGSFSSSYEFKVRSGVRGRNLSPIKSGGRANKASSLTTTITTTNNSNDDSSESDFGAFGRRGLILTATLPFILRLHSSTNGFEAHAADEFALIREEVRKVVSTERAAGVLRLAFHDAGTFDMEENSGGMNGSIIYELDRFENAGLKKSLKIVEKAKSELDKIKPVSWADMIAVSGAEAVSVCGGPIIPVQLGRMDSMVPDPEGKLPLETLDAPGLKQCFLRKGFCTQELVALSGAHTLGGKGFGSPTVFDNSYYKILLEKPWLSSAGMSSMIGLPSDHALAEDDECLRFISRI